MSDLGGCRTVFFCFGLLSTLSFYPVVLFRVQQSLSLPAFPRRCFSSSTHLEGVDIGNARVLLQLGLAPQALLLAFLLVVLAHFTLDLILRGKGKHRGKE